MTIASFIFITKQGNRDLPKGVNPKSEKHLGINPLNLGESKQ